MKLSRKERRMPKRLLCLLVVFGLIFVPDFSQTVTAKPADSQPSAKKKSKPTVAQLMRLTGNDAIIEYEKSLFFPLIVTNL